MRTQNQMLCATKLAIRIATMLQIFGLSIILVAKAEGEIREYCVQEEPFKASCLKNEVIVMTSAIYGRMRMGRCLEDEGGELFQRNLDDPKFIGCSENVQHLMDRKCSGKHQCVVPLMSDIDIGRLRPCHVSLKLYLEASYECITVIDSDRSCIVTASSSPVHITSSLTSNVGCGTNVQPWVIKAPIGQQINIRLLVFGFKIERQISEEHTTCQRFGTVMEKSFSTNISICKKNDEMNKIVYKSSSNTIQVVLDVINIKENSDTSLEQSRNLIGFQAIGCSNFAPPVDTWLRRNDNEATVGCYSSRQTWHLRCIENAWIGVIGNCTRDLAEPTQVGMKKTSSSVDLNQVTIIVVVVFLTLIICLTIICCGAVCLKRHYSLSARQHFHLIEENYKKFNTEDGQIHNKSIVHVTNDTSQ